MRLNKKIRVQVVKNLIVGVFGERIKDFEAKTKEFILEEVDRKSGDNLKWFKSLTEEQQSLINTESSFVVVDSSNKSNIYLHPEVYCSYVIDENTYIQVGERSKNNYPYCVKRTYTKDRYPCRNYCVESGSDEMKVIISQQKSLESTIKQTIEQVYKALLSVTSKKKAIEMMPDIEKYFPKSEVAVGTSLVPSELYNNINNLLTGVNK